MSDRNVLPVTVWRDPGQAGMHTVWLEVYDGKPVSSEQIPERVKKLVSLNVPFSTADAKHLDVIAKVLEENKINLNLAPIFMERSNGVLDH